MNRSDINHKSTRKTFPTAVWVMILLGTMYMGVLLTFPDDAVFYSGDGGIKYLLSKQYLNGPVGSVLEMPTVHPQTSNLWNHGLYPFGEPFVYHVENQWVVSFPFFFALVTSPFLRMLDWRGLYVLPAVSTVLVWIWISIRLISLRLRTFSLYAALVSLVFACPLTLYAAMFWEHSLATLLASLSLILILPGEHHRSTRKQHPFVLTLILGILSGLGVFFRPEVLVFSSCVIACSLLLFHRDEKREILFFALGFAFSLSAFFWINQTIYGNPFGQHATQVLNSGGSSGNYIEATLSRLSQFFLDFGHFWPAFWIILICIPFVYMNSRRLKRELIALFMVIVISIPLIAAIVPNMGGKEWGPRYLMVVMPACAILVGVMVEAGLQFRWQWKMPLWILLAASLLLGTKINSWDGTRNLADDYDQRILPALRMIQEKPQKIIVISHQWVAHEFAALVGTKDFVWPRTGKDILYLQSILRQSDTKTVLFVTYHGIDLPPYLGTLNPVGKTRDFIIYTLTISE